MTHESESSTKTYKRAGSRQESFNEPRDLAHNSQCTQHSLGGGGEEEENVLLCLCNLSLNLFDEEKSAIIHTHTHTHIHTHTHTHAHTHALSCEYTNLWISIAWQSPRPSLGPFQHCILRQGKTMPDQPHIALDGLGRYNCGWSDE